jgi:hypothetical protein
METTVATTVITVSHFEVLAFASQQEIEFICIEDE